MPCSSVLTVPFVGGALTKLAPYEAKLNEVVWSPDGKKVALIGHSNDVPIVDLATHQIKELRGHTDAIYNAQFSRDGTMLLTAGDHQTLSRASYVRQEEANDRVRAQVRALGPIKHRIASIRERGGRAEATVTVSTGFGTQQVRFVLRRERERWRVDYNDSLAE